MLMKNFVIAICSFFLLSLGGLSGLAQDSKVSVRETLVSIKVEKKPLYTVFYRLIQKYDIAIGLEESSLDRGHRHYYFETNKALEKFRATSSSDKEFLGPYPMPTEHLITLDFKEAQLDEVMDAIVKQMGNYDWEINDEVVNIYPLHGRDERLKRLLDLKVRSFVVGEGADVGSIQAQLMLGLPEFQKFLAENRLESRTDRPGSSFLDRTLPDGMGFQNMTFKHLLNAITKSKRGGWIIQIKSAPENPGREYVEILI